MRWSNTNSASHFQFSIGWRFLHLPVNASAVTAAIAAAAITETAIIAVIAAAAIFVITAAAAITAITTSTAATAINAATAGYHVTLHDVSPEAVEAGMSRIKAFLDKGVTRGKTTEKQRDDAIARVTGAAAYASAAATAGASA